MRSGGSLLVLLYKAQYTRYCKTRATRTDNAVRMPLLAGMDACAHPLKGRSVCMCARRCTLHSAAAHFQRIIKWHTNFQKKIEQPPNVLEDVCKHFFSQLHKKKKTPKIHQQVLHLYHSTLPFIDKLRRKCAENSTGQCARQTAAVQS